MISTTVIPAELSPSLDTVSWSEDGQLLVLANNVVYILTPECGIFYDTESANGTSVKVEGENSDLDLKWFRTMVCLEKATPHLWGLDSEDVSTLVLGSLDNRFRSACWSPTGLSSEGYCFLVTLQTNLDIILWSAPKNHLRGAWEKIQDVTEVLKEHFRESSSPSGEGSSNVGTTLGTQPQSISWSKTPETLGPRNSLLAVGTRGGKVAFLQLDEGAKQLRLIHSLHVTNEWVTHLDWAPWTLAAEGANSSILACGTSDGSIHLVSLVVSPVVSASVLPNVCPAKPDGSGLTGMKWVVGQLQKSVLVHTKPGIIGLWPQELPLQVLRLQNQYTCAGSSALSSPSGIHYFPEQDVLLLILCDSSVHVVYQVSTAPTLTPSTDATRVIPSSLVLSQKMRNICDKVERLESGGNLDNSDLLVSSGFTVLDHFGFGLWAYEARRPQDFEYRAQSKHRSCLIGAMLWEQERYGDVLMEHFVSLLDTAKIDVWRPPVSVLRSALFHLRRAEIFNLVKDRLLGLLAEIQITTSDNLWLSPELAATETSRDRGTFEAKFRKNLMFSPSRYRAMLGFNIANACGRYHQNSDFQTMAARLMHEIIRDRCNGLLECVTAVLPQLSDADRDYARIVAAQAALQYGQTDLARKRALETMSQIATQPPQIVLRADEVSETNFAPTALGGIARLGEVCPACQGDIVLDDVAVAVEILTRAALTSAMLDYVAAGGGFGDENVFGVLSESDATPVAEDPYRAAK
ncbi:hypothetical protein FRB99_009042 [Tulasnella sp. 403]|nr:hypothetical protein FRB99_009042 [Tulasnella sp. 403]